MEELTITLRIADRPYRLKIKKDEEEYFRKATEQINKALKDYQGNYAFKDKQDLLAIIGLEATFKSLTQEKMMKEMDKNFSSRLAELDKILTFEK